MTIPPVLLPIPTIGDPRAALPESASCRFDPELHDGPASGTETGQERAAREAVAREVCAECPVARVWCLAYARRVGPVSGIWAALLAEEIGARPSRSRIARPAA